MVFNIFNFIQRDKPFTSEILISIIEIININRYMNKCDIN